MSTSEPDDPDAKLLGELGRALPSIDVDATTGEQIARRARMDVGRGRPLRRFVLPTIALVASVTYLVWTLLTVFRVLT